MKNTLTILSFIFIPLFIQCQIYNDYIGTGHNEGVIVTSSSPSSDSDLTINGAGHGRDLAGASRFMSHAALGASLEDLIYVDEIGYEAWLEEQINLPVTSYTEVMQPIDSFTYEVYLQIGGDPAEYNPSAQQFRFAWSHIAQTAPDVLRHKIALALSEILVISTDSDLFLRGYGISSYYDVLSEHAFGNYKDLLMDVTLHPAMGFYLSHFNNYRSFPTQNIQPDENYAREIMQLFTIGLYELNNDGTRQTDANGSFIPTYDNNDIKELAKVFTGLGMTDWYFPDIPDDPTFGVPFYFIDPTIPMSMYEFYHQPGSKTIVGDYTIPGGQTGMEDIEMAVDHLFNHPNVGPFISDLLIKRLIKSNPTPEYIDRVATVFNDNGNGERGDLEAVVKAILLDEEARDCDWIDHPSNGRLKEPIQRYTQYVKGLRAEADEQWFWNQGFVFEEFTDQFPMSSPTVFNFFSPNYQPNSLFANEDKVGPEFQVFNSSTAIGYFNYLYYMTIVDFNNEVPEETLDAVGLLEGFKANLVIPELQALTDHPDAIIDYLDMVMVHGNMSPETKQAILDSTEPLEDFPEFLLKMALYLTMVSPDFNVMK